MMHRAAAKPRHDGMIVHFLPKWSATYAAGMTPTKLMTAMPANINPVALKLSESWAFSGLSQFSAVQCFSNCEMEYLLCQGNLIGKWGETRINICFEMISVSLQVKVLKDRYSPVQPTSLICSPCTRGISTVLAAFCILSLAELT